MPPRNTKKIPESKIPEPPKEIKTVKKSPVVSDIPTTPKTAKKGSYPRCRRCGEEITSDQPIKEHQNKKYHAPCYKALMEELSSKEEQEITPQQELYGFICNLFEIPEITPMMRAQLDRYTQDYGFTYMGMFMSLKYFYEIMGHSVKKDGGIGILPYVYNEAKTYYQMIAHAKQANSEFDMEKAVTQTVKKVKQIDYSFGQQIDMDKI